MDLIYKDEVYNIIGAAMEVHNELGCGFFEAVYHEALEIELLTQEIPFKKEEKIEIFYKDYLLSKFYVADFICYDKIILEIKALSELTSINEAQMLNYLKATGSKIGLLINFGTERLQFKRYVY